jgi:type II secretory pathway pseudopilin PulG
MIRIRSNEGITLAELLVTITVIGILALLVGPEIGRFRSNYNVRSCATDLIQNMRLARAMAIKENREYLIVFDTANQRYLIGFDNDGDDNLTTVNNDTFGFCKDTPTSDTDGDGINDRGDGIPDTDADANGDGVPDCVRVVNIGECGNGINIGTLAPNGPDDNGDGTNDPLCANGLGVCFGSTANPIRANFNSDGSVDNPGYVYFQQATRGYSYVVTISNTAGATNMWKWDGDINSPLVTTWTEMR